jgi:hypothetical protein
MLEKNNEINRNGELINENIGMTKQISNLINEISLIKENQNKD